MAMADYDLSDLAAVVGNRNGDADFGNGNGLLWLLFILILGWGNGGNRGWGGNQGGAGAVGGDALYPWMNLQQGFTEILQSLCGGFSSVTAAITNGFANAETAATNRAMQQMQSDFAMQTAMLQGFNAQQAQLAQCCCDNRLATANLGAQLAAEACADRAAVSDGVRDILANQNAGIQRILDKMCDQELFAERRENDNLRQQLNMANLAASQTAQTAQILADNARQTTALEQYLNPVPIPSYPVANPNCCQQTFGCGCGA